MKYQKMLPAKDLQLLSFGYALFIPDMDPIRRLSPGESVVIDTGIRFMFDDFRVLMPSPIPNRKGLHTQALPITRDDPSSVQITVSNRGSGVLTLSAGAPIMYYVVCERGILEPAKEYKPEGENDVKIVVGKVPKKSKKNT